MSMIDPDFLKQLQKGENEAIKKLYKIAFNSCANMITNNNGSIEDARDIFQEALIIFINNLQNPNFNLTAKPKTYLYAVVRNLWLNQLKKLNKTKKNIQINDSNNFINIIESDQIEEKKNIEVKYELIGEMLEQLNEDCKELLFSFYYKKMPLKKIAMQMNYSGGFVKIKKKRCMDSLKKKVLDLYATKKYDL